MTGQAELADLVVRTLSPAELVDVLRLDEIAWGSVADAERVRCYTRFLEPDRMVGVFDGPRLVAVHGAVSLRLTVPGGAQVPFAGMTWLLVHPLYRGRRVTTLLDVERRLRPEEVVAGCMLHNPAIVRPDDDFAAASRYADLELRLDRHRELTAIPDDEGHLEYVSHDTALGVVGQISSRLAGQRNGWIPRTPATDAYKYSRSGDPLNGFGAMNFVIHRDGTGAVDGFLAYRLVMDSDTNGRAEGTIRISELLATTPATEALLWAHCTANREIHTVLAPRRPVNDPIALRLRDPRALRQVVHDDLYLWITDVPGALTARRYSRTDRVVLDVRSGTGATERVALTGGLDGAECRPVRSLPDLTVSRRALAAAYLGDVTLDGLAAAGQVTEHTPGSLRRADAMFSWSPAPWIQDNF